MRVILLFLFLCTTLGVHATQPIFTQKTVTSTDWNLENNFSEPGAYLEVVGDVTTKKESQSTLFFPREMHWNTDGPIEMYKKDELMKWFEDKLGAENFAQLVDTRLVHIFGPKKDACQFDASIYHCLEYQTYTGNVNTTTKWSVSSDTKPTITLRYYPKNPNIPYVTTDEDGKNSISRITLLHPAYDPSQSEFAEGTLGFNFYTPQTDGFRDGKGLVKKYQLTKLPAGGVNIFPYYEQTLDISPGITYIEMGINTYTSSEEIFDSIYEIQ